MTEAPASARWAVNLVEDPFAAGRGFRLLSFIGDVTRKFLAAVVDHSLAGRWLARQQSVRIKRHVKPDVIVSDNGTGFPLKAMLTGAEKMQVT